MNTNRQTNYNAIKNANSFKIPDNILDDLSSRFVINIPLEERNDLIRVCFQLELAHWYYIDFVWETSPQTLPKYKYKQFTRIMFAHIPFLTKHLSQLEQIIAEWKEYKLAVPTCGAILLDKDMDYVLMVQGFGGKSWGFPKGKINENESTLNCATREVKEETGYDCENKIKSDCYIERFVCEASVRLYIICDVDKAHCFKPIARNEIKDIQWFKIIDLPQKEYDIANIHTNNTYSNQFYSVMPFIKPLRKWIFRQRQNQKRDNKLCDNDDKFWAKSWDNIKFDWDKIWKQIRKEK